MESSRKSDRKHGGTPLAVTVSAAALLVLLPTSCAHGGQRGSQGTGEVTTESFVVFDESIAAAEYVVEVLDPTGRRRFRCHAEVLSSGESDGCTTLGGIGGAGTWTLRYVARYVDGSSEGHDEAVVLEGDESQLRVRVRYVLGREGPYVRQWHMRHPRDISVVFRSDEQGKPRMAIVNGTTKALLLRWNASSSGVVLVPSSRDPRSGDVPAWCGVMLAGGIDRVDSGSELVLQLTKDDSLLAPGSYTLLIRGQLVPPESTIEEVDSLPPLSIDADVEFMFRVDENGSPFGLITSPNGRGAVSRREQAAER